MKKFVIVFVILVLAAGAVFFFGWVQIRIPPQSYAVIFSKIGGFEKQVIRSGDFVWRVKRLIPTNLQIYTFSSAPISRSFTLEGVLPSAETYASILEGSPNFGYKVEVALQFTVNPESLPGLVETAGLLPDNMGSWYDGIADRAAVTAMNLLEQKITDNAYSLTEESFLPGFDEDLAAHLQRQMPEVSFLNVRPLTLRMPDVELYARAKENYLALISLHQELLIRETAALTAREALDNRRLALLRQYGELLTAYPILLDYLAIESGLPSSSPALLDSADGP